MKNIYKVSTIAIGILSILALGLKQIRYFNTQGVFTEIEWRPELYQYLCMGVVIILVIVAIVAIEKYVKTSSADHDKN